MTTESTIRAARTRPNLKSIALPAEHGGWGFLLEPILLGLIAAFSTTGLLLGLAMLGVFLIHQPAKIATKDLLKGKNTPRTSWAWRFVLLYGGSASVLFAILVYTASAAFLLPIVAAVPLMLLQFSYDLRNKSRDLIPEISGAVALGAIAPAIAILDGWGTLPALGLWLVIALRTVPAILYVRARLRLERGKPAAILPANASHAVALIISLPFVLYESLPWIVALALGLLLLRSVWGLSPYRKPAARPAVIGIQELTYGLLFAVMVGVGYVI